ncbi:MAG TPA: Crp/Fnr family transcriptional regulator [Polyangiaceae bacterium]
MIDDLDEASQARMLSRYSREFAPGELLFSDGDPGTEAYLLQDGRVRLIKRLGAAERSLRILRPGDLFGESALLAGASRSATAVAVTAGSVLVIDQRTLEQILTSNPAVGLRVMQQLVRRLRDAEDQIEVLMLDDNRSKVVVTLVKLAQQAQSTNTDQDSTAIELNLSPLELSTRVGLELDAVKRIVQQLKDAGHLQIIGERVTIPNLGSLREMSNLLNLRDQIAGNSRDRSHTTRLGST